MKCYKCQHEFCWLCNGDFYRYRHNHGMDKYCAMSACKPMICVFFVFVLILKITSFFWDNWTVPAFVTHFTLKNVLYYSLFWLISNVGVFWLVMTLGEIQPKQRSKCTRRGNIALALLVWIFVLVCSSYTNTAIQIVIFEFFALLSAPVFLFSGIAMAAVTVVTYVLKIAL